MKRGDLIRQLNKAGCLLKRHGSGHDVYFNPRTGKSAPVPRHTEVRNTLTELIKKQLGI